MQYKSYITMNPIKVFIRGNILNYTPSKIKLGLG